MKQNEIREAIEHLLKNCPEILSPKKVAKWSPLGKNEVYELLKKGELPSVRYRGAYIIAKRDLVQYLVDHANDEPKSNLRIKEKMTDAE